MIPENNKGAFKIEGGKRRHHIGTHKTNFNPLITIITAVYNGNATIEETIKSIINQNFSNYEYIIIDGNSTDGTIDILNRYDDSIDYWLSEPDKGIYDAFNKGISLAKGHWLYFIGSDDKLFDKDVLLRFFPNHYKSKMLYGNVIFKESGKIYDGKFNKIKLYSRNICQQAIFYHHSLFDILGYFDNKYPILADYAFNIKAFGLKQTHPTFINETVAIFSTNGLGYRVTDENFKNDRINIYKINFGHRYFLYFRCLRWWRRRIMNKIEKLSNDNKSM